MNFQLDLLHLLVQGGRGEVEGEPLEKVTIVRSCSKSGCKMIPVQISVCDFFNLPAIRVVLYSFLMFNYHIIAATIILISFTCIVETEEELLLSEYRCSAILIS